MLNDQSLGYIFNPLNRTEQSQFLTQSLKMAGFEYFFYTQKQAFLPLNETRFLCSSNLPGPALSKFRNGILLDNNPFASLSPNPACTCKTLIWDTGDAINHPDLQPIFNSLPFMYCLTLSYHSFSGRKESSLTLFRHNTPVTAQEIKRNQHTLKHVFFSAHYLIRENLLHRHLEPTIPTLSPKQLEIIKYVATGMTNNKIAEILHISPYTVDFHIREIFGKTDSNHRTLATLKALLPEMTN